MFSMKTFHIQLCSVLGHQLWYGAHSWAREILVDFRNKEWPLVSTALYQAQALFSLGLQAQPDKGFKPLTWHPWEQYRKIKLHLHEQSLFDRLTVAHRCQSVNLLDSPWVSMSSLNEEVSSVNFQNSSQVSPRKACRYPCHAYWLRVKCCLFILVYFVI